MSEQEEQVAIPDSRDLFKRFKERVQSSNLIHGSACKADLDANNWSADTVYSIVKDLVITFAVMERLEKQRNELILRYQSNICMDDGPLRVRYDPQHFIYAADSEVGQLVRGMIERISNV